MVFISGIYAGYIFLVCQVCLVYFWGFLCSCVFVVSLGISLEIFWVSFRSTCISMGVSGGIVM